MKYHKEKGVKNLTQNYYLRGVNSLETIYALYASDARVATVNESLNEEKPCKLLLQNTVGSQLCFVLSAVYSNDPRTHIFIANDKEEAAYIQNTLASLATRKKNSFSSGFIQTSIKV